MNITLNGRPQEVAPGTRVDQLVPSRSGIAVAVNGVVVPAGTWPATTLSEHDAVEIVTAHQGG